MVLPKSMLLPLGPVAVVLLLHCVSARQGAKGGSARGRDLGRNTIGRGSPITGEEPI